VFNVEQIEGLPEGKFPTPERPNLIQNEDERSAELDAIFAAYGVTITEKAGGGAYYQGGRIDSITMPLFGSFTSANAYYATLAHEAIHSTGHADRLDRETLHKYGESRQIRAKEELCAEIGAAMLCAALGMEPTEREDHAAYLASWLGALKNDKRYIFQAATAAQAAANYFLEATAAGRTEEAQAA
jgi:antirestriction protein ArdC